VFERRVRGTRLWVFGIFPQRPEKTMESRIEQRHCKFKRSRINYRSILSRRFEVTTKMNIGRAKMRFLRVFSVLVVMFVSAVTVGAQPPGGQPRGAPQAGGTQRKPMIMTITGFADGSDVPVKYTVAGDETSPGITWTNTPAGTVSFLLHMHDMEGSRDRTTDDTLQWLVWNIPGSETGIPEGIPKGTQLQNGAYQISGGQTRSNRDAAYRGPGAPAAGPRHHYVFELFALDTKVDVQPGADPYETSTNALKAIQGHILGKAVYVGLFRRPQ